MVSDHGMTPTLTRTFAESRTAAALRDLQLSGRPLVWVHTTEEERIATALRSIAGSTHVWTWTVTEGLRRDGQASAQPLSARAVLDYLADLREPAVVHLKDFHEALSESAEVRRRFRDLYAAASGDKFIVITAPVREMPKEIERSVVFLELRPPDAVELREFVGGELADHNPEPALVEQMARSLQGLTLDEIRYALPRALTLHPDLGLGAVKALLSRPKYA